MKLGQLGRLKGRPFVFMTVCFLSLLAWAATMQAEEASVVDQALQEALLRAKGRLGALTPTQNRIFDSEILPQAERFVRNYRRGQSGINVSPDLEAIQKYLSFHSSAVSKDQGVPRMGVLVAAAADCAECVRDAEAIRSSLSGKLARRGFEVVPLKEGEPVPEGLSGTTSIRIQSRNVDGTETLPIQLAMRLIRSESEVFEMEESIAPARGESLFRATDALLSTAWVEIGDRAMHGRLFTQEGNHYSVEISGFKDLVQYVRFRRSVKEALSGATAVYASFLSGDTARFAVYGIVKPEEIRARLAALQTDPTNKLILGETKGWVIFAKLENQAAF